MHPALRLLAITGFGCLVGACAGAAPPAGGPVAAESGARGEVAASRAASPSVELPRERLPDIVAHAELRPLVTSIRPGKPFWLGLHLAIHEGYRVSWTYPGDLGREIRVRFSAPEGFAVGRVVYPAPSRFAVGEHEAFGWEGETAALVRITPPARLGPNDAYRFDVDADWLACKKECLRETTKAYLELSAERAGGASADDAALNALLARVPRPFEDDERASHEWIPGAGTPRVGLSVEGVKLVEFIPATEASRKGVTVEVHDDGAVLSLEYESPPGPPPHTTYGVLLGRRGEEPASYEVEIPWMDVEQGAKAQ